MNKLISLAELSKHNTRRDCWVAIHGKVFNLTSFLEDHPGGERVLLDVAGQDATSAFDEIHPNDPSFFSILPTNAYMGNLDPSAIKIQKKQPEDEATTTTTTTKPTTPPSIPETILLQKKEEQEAQEQLPSLEQMLNVFDFEAVAQLVMKKEAWDYYSSGADDEVTLRENHLAFQRIWLRPRVLINVEKIDMSCTLLHSSSSFPLYITATALAKLAHPEGELALTRAAKNHNIIQMCPTLASYSIDDMIAARAPGQTQWFQLYVNSNRQVTYDIVKKVEKGGIKALFLTVDAPQLGRREKDMRNKFSSQPPDVQQKSGVDRNQGTARAISAFIDPKLNWNDIKWFQSITKMPIILKGVQTAEDAVLAVKYGVDGIVVSNHGGRQLDFSRSGIEVLVEVMAALKDIGAEKNIAVFLDGGVRRGTDIFKAIALGAHAVGIGRPTLYGLASYGQKGVEKVIQILKDELEMCMRLMGTPTLADINPSLLSTRNLTDHFVPSPNDFLSSKTYLPLPLPVFLSQKSRL